MSSQHIGKATIKIGGVTLKSLPGAKLNMGGVKRTAVISDGGVVGYSEEVVAPMLDCTVVLGKGESAKALDFDDATATFAADTGQMWSLGNAFNTEPIEITAKDGGGIPLKISAKTCEEITS